jgi:hypothetical protein
VDRSALFVDAGHLLADGAMVVHGTRHRETVSWDFGGLLQFLGDLARERTGLPLLRCYWYEATIEGRRSPEHEALADLPGLKLRVGRLRPGRREGLDTEIQRDLTTLARNGAIADAVVVSGDEDLAPVIADVQTLGIRVTVVQVSADGNRTTSRVLRQECDDLIEIGAGQLRPYVNNLTAGDASSGPLTNGHGNGSGTAIGPRKTGALKTGEHSAPPPASPITGRLPRPERISTPPRPAPPSRSGSGSGSPPVPPAPGPMHAAPTPTPMPARNPNGGTQYVPSPPQQGPYTGPQQIAPVTPRQNTPTLSDAVKGAHQEGQEFGESVARDAPALWLEAVLARKPRMPSDLEARLLQGSSLPIDFLLHDEVRHALRRGFWDALERSRR